MGTMQRFVVFAVALGLLTHCQDYKFEQLCPETITEQEISRAAAQPTPADILFVVDNSGSMADEQENLAANFEFFINQIAGTETDYRIAVVTTDQVFDVERTGLRTQNFGPAPYRVISTSGTNTCRSTEPEIAQSCFRGPDPAVRIIRTQSLEAAQQVQAFQENVRVGSCGAGQETGISASITALQMAENGCNSGFLRPEANLVIIYVSDEDDQDNTSLANYISALLAIKPAEQIRLAAIVGFADGEANSCSVNEGAQCGSLCDGPAPQAGSLRACNGNNCPGGEQCFESRCDTPEHYYWFQNNTFCSWCSYFKVDDCCSALEGSRYVRFLRNMETEIADEDPDITVNGCAPAAMGQRSACLIDSICQANFGETLERIARDLVIDTRFTLSPPAENPAGVRARVRGGRFPEGRDLIPGEDFDVSINDEGMGTQVELKNGEIIPQGEEEKIEIFYVSEIEMPTEMMGACGPQNTP